MRLNTRYWSTGKDSFIFLSRHTRVRSSFGCFYCLSGTFNLKHAYTHQFDLVLLHLFVSYSPNGLDLQVTRFMIERLHGVFYHLQAYITDYIKYQCLVRI